MPRAYLSLEERIKNYVQKNAVSRAKVDVYVTIDSHSSPTGSVKLDASLAENYIEALRELRDKFSLVDDISVMSVAQNRDIFSYDKPEEDLEAEWESIRTTLDEAIKICGNRIFIRLDVKEDTNGKIFWEFERDIWPLLEKYKAYTTVIATWHSAFNSNGYKFTRELRERTTALCGRPMLNFMKNEAKADLLTRTIKSYDLSYMMRLTCNFSEYSYKTFLAENKTRFEGFKGKIRIYADVHNTNPAYPENCESTAFYGELYDVGINVQLVNKGFMMCKYIAENFSATEYTK